MIVIERFLDLPSVVSSRRYYLTWMAHSDGVILQLFILSKVYRLRILEMWSFLACEKWGEGLFEFWERLVEILDKGKQVSILSPLFNDIPESPPPSYSSFDVRSLTK
jgi:hypothetical protein